VTLASHRTLFLLVAAAAAPVVTLGMIAAANPHVTDFGCFWTGAQLVSVGLNPYDSPTWASAVTGVFAYPLGGFAAAPCPGRYGYPLWTALATLPFGLAPLEVASIVWMALLFGGIAGGIALLARAAGLQPKDTLVFAAIVLSSQPAWLTALTSQYGGLELVGLGLMALPGTAIRPSRFALAQLLLLLKPHLALFVAIERAHVASASARIAAAATAGALVVASLVVRPSWPVEWFNELVGHRTTMAGGSPTLWGLALSFTGKPELALATVAFALAAFVVVLRRVDVLDSLDRVAVSVTGWLLVLPYLSTADPIVLAVAWCAILRRALVPRRSIGLLVALVVAANLVPWALYATKEPAVADVRNALVIPVTAALLAVVLKRRSVAATAGAPQKLEPGRIGAAAVTGAG
jgi:hypothetical protein